MRKNLGWVCVFVLFCCFLLCAGSAFTAAAAVLHVYDYGGILTEEEEVRLSQEMDQLIDALQLDLTIVTTDGLGGVSAQEYGDDFYDTNGLGYGDTWDGLLLLVDMEIREYWTMTDGAAVDMFSDGDFDFIHRDLSDRLSQGAYYDAFRLYLEDVEEVVLAYRSGESNLGNAGPGLWRSAVQGLPLIVIIAAVLAFISVRSMVKKNKSVQQAPSAEHYMTPGSLNLLVNTDTFLRTHTVTIKVSPSTERHNGGSGIRGGGVHRSRSGHIHGGRGGKF